MTLFGWDYGTVPAWFSGSSLFLALYIILRDRKKAEKEQARSLVCWVDVAQTRDDETRFFNNKITIHNTGARPILIPKIVITFRKLKYARRSVDKVAFKMDLEDLRDVWHEEYLENSQHIFYAVAEDRPNEWIQTALEGGKRGIFLFKTPLNIGFFTIYIQFRDTSGNIWRFYPGPAILKRVAKTLGIRHRLKLLRTGYKR